MTRDCIINNQQNLIKVFHMLWMKKSVNIDNKFDLLIAALIENGYCNNVPKRQKFC